MKLLSVPLQIMLLRWTGPVPVPNWALLNATAPVSYNVNITSITKSRSIPLHWCWSDHELGSPVVDTPQLHHCIPKSCHTQYPTNCWYRSPLCPHLECFLQPVADDHTYMELFTIKMQVSILHFYNYCGKPERAPQWQVEQWLCLSYTFIWCT